MPMDAVERSQWTHAKRSLLGGTTVMVHVSSGEFKGEWWRAMALITIKGQRKAKLLTNQQWVDIDMLEIQGGN